MMLPKTSNIDIVLKVKSFLNKILFAKFSNKKLNYSSMYICIFGFKGAPTSQVIGTRNEMMDDNDGQMDIRGPCGPKAS